MLDLNLVDTIKDVRNKLVENFDRELAKSLLKLIESGVQLDMLLRLKAQDTIKVDPKLLHEVKLTLDLLDKERVYTREYINCKQIVNKYLITIDRV